MSAAAAAAVSGALQDAFAILLRNIRPSLPPELIVHVYSFLSEPIGNKGDPPNAYRSFSSNATLRQPNEELWQVDWLISLAKVNRELDELLRPLLWTNVAIYLDYEGANAALVGRLRKHLERFPRDRQAISRLTLDLTITDEFYERRNRVGFDVNVFMEFHEDWPFEGMEGYEDECIRLAAIFPENLYALHVNTGQLRLPVKAWQHIAQRCPKLAVARIDAGSDWHPFTKDWTLIPPSTRQPEEGPCYPLEDDAFHLLRQVRGVALGCGPDDPPLHGEHDRWRGENFDRIAVSAPNLTDWLTSNPAIMWLRFAAPEMPWQPSMFGVWARVLGLAMAPLDRRPDDAFVIGSHEHGRRNHDDGIAETDILMDTAAMALRPHLDKLAQSNRIVTAEAVLSMVASQPELAVWTMDGGCERGRAPFFSTTSYDATSARERRLLDAIIAGYTSTEEARQRGRELGCPFEGVEYMEENTIELARAHLLREMPATLLGRQTIERLAAMSPSFGFAEAAREAKRIE